MYLSYPHLVFIKPPKTKVLNSDLSMNSESFNFLKSSSEFLNLVLENITGCVLLLDRHMELVAFNNPLKTIFSNKRDEDLLYMKCGESIGCAYQIDEAVKCGTTTKCKFCELRIAALETYTNNEVVYKEHITKPFYNFNNEKEDKHLQFSTRLFKFKGETYILLILDDITKFVETQKQLSEYTKLSSSLT